MATRPPKKTLSVPAVEADSSLAEAASERLQNLLGVFGLLIALHREAQEHHAEMNLYAKVAHSPLLRDPSDPDILMDIAESEKFLPFVFNATIVFAVTVLDDLLESMKGSIKENGNQKLVAKANAVIDGRFCTSDSGESGPAGNPGKFRTRYVFVSLYLNLMEELEAQDALKQPTNKPIQDKRFVILELYRKRCLIAHDDPFADMHSNPVVDYVSAYRFVQRLTKKWNESFSPALNHEPPVGTS